MTGGRIVVLGAAGRNFGAGMSGGVAYVYDEDGTFASRVNPEMVDLEDLDDEDRAWLTDRIERHHDATGSTVARRILDQGDEAFARFAKVMPRDYKRVLEAQRQAEADGTDPVEAIMAAARA
jgi:glutamate synthase (NADPH) large chain